LAHTIAVVDAGRIIARGTADELKARVGGERIELVVRDRSDLARAAQLLAPVDRRDVTLDEHTRRLSLPARSGAQRLVEAIRELDEAGIGIDDIGLHRPTLDDVFLSLTGRGTASLAGEDEAAGGRAR
jgi:ABC-2 type transport system ATP-binding protein